VIGELRMKDIDQEIDELETLRPNKKSKGILQNTGLLSSFVARSVERNSKNDKLREEKQKTENL